MNEQPTPEATEAVAEALYHRLLDDLGKPRRPLATRPDGIRCYLAGDAQAAIAAYVEHQRQHAPDALAADLAAILEERPIKIESLGHGFHDRFEATVPSEGEDDYIFFTRTGTTIPEAVAALRRQIEGAEG